MKASCSSWDKRGRFFLVHHPATGGGLCWGESIWTFCLGIQMEYQGKGPFPEDLCRNLSAMQNCHSDSW